MRTSRTWRDVIRPQVWRNRVAFQLKLIIEIGFGDVIHDESVSVASRFRFGFFSKPSIYQMVCSRFDWELDDVISIRFYGVCPQSTSDQDHFWLGHILLGGLLVFWSTFVSAFLYLFLGSYQEFQAQASPGKEGQAEPPCSPVDQNANW